MTVQLPPLTCAHRRCHRHAQHAVMGQHASYAACNDHLAAIRQRCGEPCDVRPLEDAGEPDQQPSLYDDPNGGAAA